MGGSSAKYGGPSVKYGGRGHQPTMGGPSAKYGGGGVSIFLPVCTGSQNPQNYFSNTYVLPSVNRTAGPIYHTNSVYDNSAAVPDPANSYITNRNLQVLHKTATWRL